MNPKCIYCIFEIIRIEFEHLLLGNHTEIVITKTDTPG